MASEGIQVILFDYGGVLAQEGFRNGLAQLAQEQNLPVEELPDQAMDAVYDSGFVLGTGTAADFWALLRQRSSLQGEDEVLSQRILQGFILRPWMLDVVKALRSQGYITGILSDQTDWLDRLDARDHFYTAFDHIFNSYHLGKGKRDKTLFTDVAQRLDVMPASILFVDDAEGNVARARAVGYQTIHYQDRESFLSTLDKMLGRPVALI